MTKRFTQNQLAAAKSVNLLDYLTQRGYKLKPKGADLCLEEHDSLVISRNSQWQKWNWFSRGFGGRNAIDFMTTVEKVPYVDAVIRLSQFGKIQSYQPTAYTPTPITTEKRPPILPWRHENSHAAFAYLSKTRGIDEKIIRDLMRDGLIYQSVDVRLLLRGNKKVSGISREGMERALQKGLIDKIENDVGWRDGEAKYMILPDAKRETLNTLAKNKEIRDYFISYGVVFLGKNEKGEIAYASKRSTTTQFRQEAVDSDKSVGFYVEGRRGSNKVFVTESPIDALSVMTLGKLQGIDCKQYHYLSLGGVSDRALGRFVKNHPNVKEIALCLDSDETGIAAAEKYAKKYSGLGYDVKIRAPSSKDFNDDLMMTLAREEYEEEEENEG